MNLQADAVLGWIAIGAAASLAAMIWPFRRGAMGVFINFAAGIGGAIGVALLSYLVVPTSHARNTTERLFYAAVGSIAALCAVHAAWSRHARVRHRGATAR